MNVYLLYEGAYSDRQLLGVFRELETAKTEGGKFRRASWSTHPHVWPEPGANDWDGIRVWACDGFDEPLDERGGHYHFGCELEIEERALVLPTP